MQGPGWLRLCGCSDCVAHLAASEWQEVQSMSTHWGRCDAGYHNSVPFLAKEIVDTSEGHVRPLFQHLLHPRYGASLSFIGLPATVATFPQFEIQARLVSRMLSGRAAVPSQEAMEAWAEVHYRCASRPGAAPAWHASPACINRMSCIRVPRSWDCAPRTCEPQTAESAALGTRSACTAAACMRPAAMLTGVSSV